MNNSKIIYKKKLFKMISYTHFKHIKMRKELININNNAS